MAEGDRVEQGGGGEAARPAALAYQRALAGELSATRRQCARMLKVVGWLMLVFALLLAWAVVERVMLERRTSWVRDPLLPFVMRPRYTYVIHWSRLVWPLASMLPAVVLGATCWVLGRLLSRSRARVYTVTALALAVLLTLAGTGLLLTFLVAGTANLEWRRASVATAAASLVGMAVVIWMGYLSVRLMDLLGERPIAGDAHAKLEPTEAKRDVVGELESMEAGDEEEDV